MYSIVLIVIGAIGFCSLGLLLGNIAKDAESVTGIANTIVFPMMFLLGAFWPVELMPKELQVIAKIYRYTIYKMGLGLLWFMENLI